jgi:hypothetical protein
MTGTAPEAGGGEIGRLIAAFDSGDPARQGAAFYDLLALYGAAREVAATAAMQITAADEARQVAEDQLGAERRLHAEQIGSLTAQVTQLGGDLATERRKSRRLEGELAQARGEIRELGEANNMLAEENEDYADREESGQLSVRGVAGFTFVGGLPGGTRVYAQTPGERRAAVVVEATGTALTLRPKVTPTAFDPTIFGGTPAGGPAGGQHPRKGKRR